MTPGRLAAPGRAAGRPRPRQGLDAVLVTNLLNVRYLTGFTGSNGALLVRTDGADLFGTDGRYTTQAGTQVPDVELLVDRGDRPGARPGGRARGASAGSATSPTTSPSTGWPRWRRCSPTPPTGERCPSWPPSAGRSRPCARSRTTTRSRRCAVPAPWPTRRWPSWPPRARCGPGARSCRWAASSTPGCCCSVPRRRPSRRSSRPARTPPSRTTAPTRPCCGDGDFLKLDFGATVDGYHSDMTRTVVLGHAADWQREIYELVAASQAAGRAALAVGADVVALDAAVAGRDRRGRPRRALLPRPRARRRAWRSTRRRVSGRSARVPWLPAWPSPWSRASTYPAAAVSGSRTR